MMLPDFKLKSGYIHPLSWDLILKKSDVWSLKSSVWFAGFAGALDFSSAD
jgi:hypothetical protein